MRGMPTFQADLLETFCADILGGAGMTPEDRRRVAAHLVDAELKNVVSHGVNRVPYYLGLFAQGGVRLTAEVRVRRTGRSVIAVDGGGGLGILAMERAVDELAAAMEDEPIACAGIANVSHTGRLGAYSERLAAGGRLAMVLGGGGGGPWRMVAAHGGRGAALSTNPWAVALPGGGAGDVSVDFATCVVANGKLRLRRRTGEAVPEGWLIDRDGRATTSLDDYADGGAILPAGGHKGYGLAVIGELVGGAMFGPPLEFNWLIIALDTGAFGAGEDYDRQSRRIIENLRATPPAPGTDRVRVPGDPERESESRKRQSGIALHAEVWQGLVDAAREVSVPVPAFPETTGERGPGVNSDYTAK